MIFTGGLAETNMHIPLTEVDWRLWLSILANFEVLISHKLPVTTRAR